MRKKKIGGVIYLNYSIIKKNFNQILKRAAEHPDESSWNHVTVVKLVFRANKNKKLAL